MILNTYFTVLPFFKKIVYNICNFLDLVQKSCFFLYINHFKTRKNAIVEYLDYQIPVTQLYGDMQAAKRD